MMVRILWGFVILLVICGDSEAQYSRETGRDILGNSAESNAIRHQTKEMKRLADAQEQASRNQEQAAYMISAAIIASGAMIALAVFYSTRPQGGGGVPTTPG